MTKILKAIALAFAVAFCIVVISALFVLVVITANLG